MSQLSTEYLLHCQDMLSAQLSGLEERLQAALSLVQRGEEQQTELEKNVQEAKQENRRRKKLITTQQLLLQTSANNYHKKSEWKKKFQEAQNRHRQEKVELKGENARLVKALSVEKNSGSSLQKLQQQVVSLSSQLSQKDRLIKSQEEKIKKLSVMAVSAPVVLQKAQDSPEEPEEEDVESMEDSDEPQWKVLKSHKGKSELMKESRPILEELLEKKLENMGLRKETHSYIFVSGGKKNSTPVKEKSLRSREGSKSSTWRTKSQQPQALVPTATPRSNAPQNQTPKTQQKKNGTPPFSSDEDESVEDSAYITSSRGKPSPSVRLVQSGSLLNPTAEPDWTDSELSEASDTPKLHKSPNSHGSVVQTLTKSLERQLSTPVKKPVGGTRVLPPSSSSPRPVIVKQRALSDEESDLELSSIEELTANRARVHKSSEVGGTSGTSAWSSAASRPGAW
ncbi:zinc finger protein DZIP1L-like [Sinocyclocheilus grahami]|uniref:zinc finger protein DZIP1L-like n=1 Tax=Sinocyclocheilus grahami TaxID=75366 RepID=UPI0007AC5F78|nr:PREDICTED: zinc finger protein DZIP1L-like [Sinocyclocheilus grahami]